MRLAHLSDPHLAPLPCPRARDLLGKRASGFLSWQLRRRFRHRPEVLEAVVADLRAFAPDHIVVTGDLANLSLPEEFVRAARWLAGLGSPERVSLVPGNHDAYVRLAPEQSAAQWTPWITDDDGRSGFPWLRRRPPLALIGLSSAVPSAWFRATGSVGETQLEALERMLADLGDEDLIRVLLVHHPPLERVPRRKALLDREALLRVIARHGVELVLAGHLHRFAVEWLFGPRQPVPLLLAPSASLLSSAEGCGGYVRLVVEGTRRQPRIEVELRRFDPGSGRVTGTGRFSLSAAAAGRAEAEMALP
ncbi:3',5'-cyclic adenosine monophosphate phosphodiesterase CpdA [bacterium HR40]|nr:3',5'-cyclic adenosine monophosphate phosphodiesterase CpdA [bacterium HR40]